MALAVLGLVLNLGLETQENYKYMHSAWHVCEATAICFLLPPYTSSLGKRKGLCFHYLENNRITPIKSPSDLENDRIVTIKSPSDLENGRIIPRKSPSDLENDRIVTIKSPSDLENGRIVPIKSPSDLENDRIVPMKSPSQYSKE